MDRVDATTSEIGTAQQLVEQFSLFVDSSDRIAYLKRVLRLVTVLGTVALSISLGYKVIGLVGSAVMEAGAQMHWLNVVGGHIGPKSPLLRH
jgi:hypothetical protein